MMGTMRDFEVPLVSGEISLCEIDGRMQSARYEDANINIFTLAVEKHPKIHITRETLHSSLAGDEGRTLFLPVETPFLKQLTQAYSEQGLEEALHTAAAHHHFLISGTASVILNLIRYTRKLKQKLYPMSHCSSETMINLYSQTRDWSSNSIRYMAWHPHMCKIAVATCDDSIRVYSSDSAFVPLLRCKQMKNISVLAWRPLSNSELAVGHDNGIIVWNIDPSSLVSRPSITNAIVLERSDHKPVLDLAWTPKGNLLITASSYNTKVLVWDVELDKTSALSRPGGYRSVLIRCSPTGEKLMTATADKVFRVWDCCSWNCERWTVLTGRVQTACWSSCGTNLLFATTTEPIIYGLIVKSDSVFATDTVVSENQAIPIYDSTKIEIHGITVGGLIQSMEMDPSGKHLAVLFQHSDSIAVFSVANRGMQLLASSLVVGLPEERPSTICFQKNFKFGACLTIGWSSGRVQYYPIIYTDLALYSIRHIM